MKRIIVLAIGMLVVGFFIGRALSTTKVLSSVTEGKESSTEPIRYVSKYKFVSPLVECEPDRAAGVRQFSSLEKKLADYILTQKNAGVVTSIAVYFRDLNNGPWIGVNEREVYSPASLLKLPVLMAYYKKAEVEENILSKKVKYETKSDILPQDYIPENSLKKGESYTIAEVIDQMMIYSDNTALVILLDNIEPAYIDGVTLDLDISTPSDLSDDDFLSVKAYSSFFRILYNASYLSQEHSEKALELLSRSKFMAGIKGGVPTSVTVSHKFGERKYDNGTVQLHDCGIVYYKTSPYLLCVMTKGNDFSQLEKIIAKISQLTFAEVEGRENGN